MGANFIKHLYTTITTIKEALIKRTIFHHTQTKRGWCLPSCGAVFSNFGDKFFMFHIDVYLAFANSCQLASAKFTLASANYMIELCR